MAVGDGTEAIWATPNPSCDICKTEGRDRPAAYDAATRLGPWALLCEEHFHTHAYGLGRGRGQRLVEKPGQPDLDTAVKQQVANELGLDISEVV